MEWVVMSGEQVVHLRRMVGDVEVFCIDKGGHVSNWRQVSASAEVDRTSIQIKCSGIWADPDIKSDRLAAMLADELTRICALLEEK